MGCTTCKEPKTKNNRPTNPTKNANILVKLFYFLMFTTVMVVPIIILFVVMLFNAIVLSKSVDITKLFIRMTQKSISKYNDIEDDEYDEYELENKHDIIEIKK